MITTELSRQWQQTKPHWLDAKCQTFEKTYIDVALTGVNAATKAIYELDKLISKVRSDCE